MNIIVLILLSGLFSAAIGVLFGLPSLRIKGFYLAVATLAAQFFLQWAFVRVPWLFNYNASGAIEVPQRTVFGVPVTGATRHARDALFRLPLPRRGADLVRLQHRPRPLGRSWMAVRDMDIAAELMGIKLLNAKLLAFAVSSFYCGVAGAMMIFLWYGGGEAADVFNIRLSFNILFMVIIGGLGSLIGSFFGAAFIASLPTILKFGLPAHRHPAGGRDRRACHLHARRRADHLLPDRRAARAGAALADREAETADLAVPLLRSGQAQTNDLRRISSRRREETARRLAGSRRTQRRKHDEHEDR